MGFEYGVRQRFNRRDQIGRFRRVIGKNLGVAEIDARLNDDANDPRECCIEIKLVKRSAVKLIGAQRRFGPGNCD